MLTFIIHSKISRKYSATGTFVGDLTEENETLKDTMKLKDKQHQETFQKTAWDHARDRAEHFKLNMKLNRENEKLVVEKCAMANKVQSIKQTVLSTQRKTSSKDSKPVQLPKPRDTRTAAQKKWDHRDYLYKMGLSLCPPENYEDMRENPYCTEPEEPVDYAMASSLPDFNDGGWHDEGSNDNPIPIT